MKNVLALQCSPHPGGVSDAVVSLFTEGMSRINTEKRSAPTSWHEDIAARTDAKGEFAFVLNQPGWWCCMASVPGVPLKGPDGQPKPLQLGSLFWLYVDSPAADARKR